MGIRVDPETEARILALAAAPPAPGGGSVSHPTPDAGTTAAGSVALVVWVPVLPRSEANAGGRLKAKVGRKEAVKRAVRATLPWAVADLLDWPRPVRVRLTRVGGKRLDKDNLAASLKAVQDVCADFVGADDGDRRAVRWCYHQKPGWEQGVEIQIGGTE